jgi:ABC-type multidrug transport system permease subunit
MNPLWQLTLTRVREFYREPAAVFWVYIFPLAMAIALGIAFRERPAEQLSIDVASKHNDPESVRAALQKLKADKRLEAREVAGDEWKIRLRSGKTDLVVFASRSASGELNWELWDEEHSSKSVLARNVVENVLLGEKSPSSLTFEEHHLHETGSRYIDFLIPGLLGMNLMGGGLFGVGFVIVDMRVRKLLKRFLATPMKRSDFLVSIMLSRMLFTIPEVILLLTFGYLAFDVEIRGNLAALILVIVLGAYTFAGLGLLIASRAKTIETVSGLMNLAMLPMYVLSGVFFSSERFPDLMQPLIQALPLTALNNAMRAIMLEGRSLADVWRELAVLVAWGAISFALALRFFRWK